MVAPWGWAMFMDWMLAFAIVGTAALSAVFGVCVVAYVGVPNRDPRPNIFTDLSTGSVFLFDGEALIDSSPAARALLAASPIRGGHWPRLLAFLSDRFPDIDAQLSQLPETGAISMVSTAKRGQHLLVQADCIGGLTRIVLSDPDAEKPTTATDPLAHRAMSEELGVLRDVVANAPALFWQENPAGDVIWANGAYLLTAYSTLEKGVELNWPFPNLFERSANAQNVKGQRQSITPIGQSSVWFDTSSKDSKSGKLLYAIPADAAVHAEKALRDFVQTLTKTFAQLPIGLAIFDHNRNLQLFNPALMDLTNLKPDFLSSRPSLLAVLDAMREANMLPEPKNYRNWRRQVLEMEKAAASGLFEETWNLPDGQTYRVIGRPHPNGALALMIDDISNEMMRTRRYRADLELGQSVIDEMSDAVAVFAQSGALVMSNTAYEQLWCHDPTADLAHKNIHALSTFWRVHAAPSSVWQEIVEYVSTVGDRISWHAEARLLDGRLINCRFSPLAGGATLVAFNPVQILEAEHPQLAGKINLRSA